ncbi:MAG: amidohydrolase family protein [Candidatus Hydrogenedens sp.]|nr:amidohydrolase family protein [Candidatus Hydrogenedens sp.]
MQKTDSKGRILRGRWLGRGPVLDLEVRAGRVVSTGAAKRRHHDAGSERHNFGPTLLDIQVNGAIGVDLQDPTLEAGGLHTITRHLAQWGVSRWVPTLVTDSLDAMESAARVIVEALSDAELAAAIPGIHLEGPFISPMDGPRGAHPLAHVLQPDVKAFRRLDKACGGKLLYMTLAPEGKGAVTLIRAICGSGARVSLGHHHAEAAAIRAAADAGATLCTHLGNGVLPQLQRHFNPLWPQLADERLTASVIADGHHLPEDVLRTIVRAKGAQRIIAVSDAVHLSGLKPGPYEIFGGKVELLKTGKIVIPGTPLLAGSASMLTPCVAHLAKRGGMTWAEAFASASKNPARALGLPPRDTRPVSGKAADFLLLDPESKTMQPEAVYIRGQRLR